MGAKEIQEFIAHLDLDKDGVITFDEWMDFLMLIPHQPTLKNVVRFYRSRVFPYDAEEAVSNKRTSIVHLCILI